MSPTVISSLALQPPEAMQACLRTAVVAIDAELGLGYAKSNPNWLGAFVQACAAFCEAEVLKQGSQDT